MTRLLTLLCAVLLAGTVVAVPAASAGPFARWGAPGKGRCVRHVAGL